MVDRKKISAYVLAGALACSMVFSSVNTAYASTTETSESAGTEESSENSDSSKPEKPDKPDENSGGNGQDKPKDKPSGDGSEKKDSDKKASDDSDGTSSNNEAPGGAPGDAPGGEGGFGGGANTQTYDYTGTLSGTLVADGKSDSADGQTISATEADQNVALSQNGGILKIINSNLTKSGSDENGDNCNFYGINSILLSSGTGSMAYISDSILNADSTGSNGIFATDSATVYANNDKISTTGDNSRGLDATYGGSIIANLMKINTQGDHCAALATDRGGGNISVTNSSINTEGNGSPLLYSTGDIEVDNVTGTATGSQIAGMEGLNKILIYNSNLSSTITSATASDPIADGVIIYQSTSGDAETSTGDYAQFEAVNSYLSSNIESGSMFYVTNTNANIILQGTELAFDSTKANLLQIEGNDDNGWGTAGENGATVNFTAYGETLSGDISVDTISSANLYFLEGTSYTGSMTITENAVNTNATESPVTVNLSADSTWIVTADTTISNLNAEDGATIVDEDGKSVSIIVAGQKVVDGDSNLSITVEGSYSSTVSVSEVNELTTSYIDRSDFDEYYGTNTAFSTNVEKEESGVATGNVTNEVSSNTKNYTLAFALASGAGIISIGTLFYFMNRRKKS